MSENEVVWVLLFGNEGVTRYINLRIIKSSIGFIKESKKFNKPIFSWYKPFQDITCRKKFQNVLFNLLWKAVRFSFCACIVILV